ncbi:MAG: hypothetical protein JSW27_12040 [Phycisphaerales bacterium]|nr:MAG: hypothetical protein JSW27_12040 [Phycisphaerales bacterium]
MMDRQHLHRPVVMDGDQLCGIITRTDVLEALEKSLSRRRGAEWRGLAGNLKSARCDASEEGVVAERLAVAEGSLSVANGIPQQADPLVNGSRAVLQVSYGGDERV